MGVRSATAALICGLALAWPGIAQARIDPYAQPTLVLEVDKKLEVGHRARVTATGIAPSLLLLTIFVDPLGATCPPAATDRPARAKVLISDLSVGDAYSVDARYRPMRPGTEMFCGYLGPSDAPAVKASEARIVHVALLRAAVARHTVPLALRRHGFARRVVRALEQHCRRTSRDAFACRFKAQFEGYKLVGKGGVRLTADGVTYRFRVRAQGVHFVLTDRNEERR